MKFGGALMKDASGIVRVGKIIEEFSCEPLVVVVSALGKTTNALEKCLLLKAGNGLEQAFSDIKLNHINIINNLFDDKVPDDLSSLIDNQFSQLWDALNTEYCSYYKKYDRIVGFGETLSSCIVTHWLGYKGLKVRRIDAAAIIYTDSNYTDAGIDWQYTSKLIQSRLIPVVDSGDIVVTQGFVGADKTGFPTTLGREGSDFTAAVIGNVISADDVTIWKNVPGIMNADPNKFDDAKKFSGLSYHEAIELAYYGASVIHPKTIQPLKQKSIPLYVRSYNDPVIEPTAITNDDSFDRQHPSIIIKEDQVLLSISTLNLSFIAEENLRQIFAAFSKHKIHLNMMQNSAVSFSVSFNYNLVKLENLLDDLNKAFTVKYNTNLTLVTLRHYDDELYNRIIGQSKIYLIQKSRVTLQALIKG